MRLICRFFVFSVLFVVECVLHLELLVLLPFADLGIADPAAASLALLGVASEPGELNVWATVPDQNLGRTWAQVIQFASLAAGIAPADGVWADTLLDVATVTSEPSPADLLGAGDEVTITLSVRNVGSATLPALTLNGTTTGGFSLNNAPQAASNLAPTAAISLTLNGAVTTSGGVTLLLSDSYHRPYELKNLAYTVDSAAPISVSLAITAVKPFSNTLAGFAADDSPLGLFEVEITGGAGTQIISCPAAGLPAGAVTCPWNAGSLADGAILALRARAADVHGNLSGWSDAISAVVDATPPQLAFSAAALTALGDGWLNASELTISGTLTDDRAIAQIQLCAGAEAVGCAAQDVLPDGAWALSAPDLGNALTTTVAFAGAGLIGKASPEQEEVVTTTLTWTGFDLAGNASQSLTETVVIATDTAGNKSAQFAGVLDVADPLAAVLSDFGAVQQGEAILVTWETVSEVGNIGFKLFLFSSCGRLTIQARPSRPGSRPRCAGTPVATMRR